MSDKKEEEEKNEIESKIATATDSPTAVNPVWEPRFTLDKLSKLERVVVIVNHRLEIAACSKIYATPPGYIVPQEIRQSVEQTFMNTDVVNPAGEVNLPSNFEGLKNILLGEMSRYEFNYLVGYKIELEIIEDAQTFTRIFILGQDNVGDVVSIGLYCDNPDSQDDNLQLKVGYGCKISIANPYIKIAKDGRKMIRIDDDVDLFIHKDKDPKKCRFCGKANSLKRCTDCKKAYYCSKECQANDWKILKHKSLCGAYRWILGNLKY